MLNKDTTLMANTTVSKMELRPVEAGLLQRIGLAGEKDKDWKKRREELEKRRKEKTDFPKPWDLREGILYYKDRLFVPDDEHLHTEIAKRCQYSEVARHFGQEKTLEIMTRDFHWKNLTKWINDDVRSCSDC